MLNTERNAATAIATRVASSLGTLKSEGILASVRLGLACAPLDGAEAERLLVVARDQATEDGVTGITPPEAIH